MLRFCLLMAVAVLLAACSTTPVTKATATRVPPDEVYAHDLVHPKPKATATVTFFRDSGFFGSGCTHTIYVNGTRAFDIDPAEYLILHLLPGPYLFKLKSGGGICPNIAISQETMLRPGSDEAYRILLPSDGSLRMIRIK